MWKKKVIYWLRYLIGDGLRFSLETRIFHAVCLVLIACAGISIPFAFYLDIPNLSLLLSAVAGMAGILYYLSRISGRRHLSVALFQVFINVALAFNYYLNSGINGPTYTIFLLAFLVCVTTCPTKQYRVWLPINILLLISLLSVEFFVPSSVKTTYTDSTARYVDLAFSYVLLAGFAFMIAAYIRRVYNQQHQELTVKSQALAATNITMNKLFSIIGHDLKEPLASLQNYLEVLVDFDLEENERRELESHLLAMTKNASAMLSNILLWTKGQMQNLNPDIQTLIVCEALTLVIDQIERIGKNKGVHLQTDIPDSISVRADQHMLEIIVRNILMNAVKFTPKEANVGSVRTPKRITA